MAVVNGHVDRDRRLTLRGPRPLEASSLQALVPQDQAARFPPQRLDPVAPAIDEQEQVPVEHVHLEHRLDQSPQPFESLAEIDRLGADIDLRSVRQPQHHASPQVVRASAMAAIDSLMSAGSSAGKERVAPLGKATCRLLDAVTCTGRNVACVVGVVS
jgi:hypothetical protein